MYLLLIPLITMHNWSSNLTSSTLSLKYLLNQLFKAPRKKYKETQKWSIRTLLIKKTCFRKDFSPEVKAEAETKIKHQNLPLKLQQIEVDL